MSERLTDEEMARRERMGYAGTPDFWMREAHAVVRALRDEVERLIGQRMDLDDTVADLRMEIESMRGKALRAADDADKAEQEVERLKRDIRTFQGQEADALAEVERLKADLIESGKSRDADAHLRLDVEEQNRALRARLAVYESVIEIDEDGNVTPPEAASALRRAALGESGERKVCPGCGATLHKGTKASYCEECAR